MKPLTIRSLRTRAVRVPMRRPLGTSGGTITQAAERIAREALKATLLMVPGRKSRLQQHRLQVPPRHVGLDARSAALTPRAYGRMPATAARHVPSMQRAPVTWAQEGPSPHSTGRVGQMLVA